MASYFTTVKSCRAQMRVVSDLKKVGESIVPTDLISAKRLSHNQAEVLWHLSYHQCTLDAGTYVHNSKMTCVREV